ncbi:glycosyltransferase family 4 protein [Mesorhizobium sp.]|uniref:glycosyltransferase family 4 protein n=1 Tax=Mesorhizobium sp. TaxID=1871066 RepID=UPI00258020C9|nr:glycosyltransferase family 4 protein [Mesorhizobium sp.]
MTRHISIVQPAMPSYRRALFERMASKLGSTLVVYASNQQELGVLSAGKRASWQRDLGRMRSLVLGLEWQEGACSVPVRRGDVLVICGAPRTLTTVILLFKGIFLGAHTIWWGHYWSSTSRPWRAAIRYALMRLPDAIIFYTDQEVDEYRAAGGLGNKKLVFGLNNGIETGEIVRFRVGYLAQHRPRDLLFLGRITPKAELDVLLDALSLPGCAGVTLDIVGSGHDEARLRERCAYLAITDRVAWHGGTTDERQIAAIANQCKAFVYPGSVGLSLIHGLSYGLPAIVHGNRWTHMPEIAALKPGKNGVTFQQGEAHSLASVIAALLGDHTLLNEMSHSATDSTAVTFNAADMAERFCSVIEKFNANSLGT